MEKAREIIRHRSITAFEALTLMLVGLKLAGVINISWWWVLSPVWVPVSVIMLLLLTVLFLIFMGRALVYIKRRRSSAKDPAACRSVGPVLIHRGDDIGAGSGEG